MSDAVFTADRPLQSRSGRLLSLVRKLVDYGNYLLDALNPRLRSSDNADLVPTFGTGNVVLILTRIALGIHRAGLLEAKIVRTAAQIDAGPQPEPAPAPRPPRAPPVQPRAPRLPPEGFEPSGTFALLERLPTVDQIAAKVRRQPIGAVLAELCRDLGISRGHPLWDELHAAIMEFGGGFIRLVAERFNRLFPISHIVARLKDEREAPPEPDGTGPPVATAT